MFDRRRVVWSPQRFVLSLLCQAMRPSVKLTWFDTQQLCLVYQIQTKRRLKFMITSVIVCYKLIQVFESVLNRSLNFLLSLLQDVYNTDRIRLQLVFLNILIEISLM